MTTLAEKAKVHLVDFEEMEGVSHIVGSRLDGMYTFTITFTDGSFLNGKLQAS